MGFKTGDFLNSEKHAKSAISIPIYPKLTEKNLVKISNLINKFFYNRLKINNMTYNFVYSEK